MDWNILWIIFPLTFVILETWGLMRTSDEKQPLTYWLREVLDLRKGWKSPGWWLVAGFIGWFGYHLLIQGVI